MKFWIVSVVFLSTHLVTMAMENGGLISRIQKVKIIGGRNIRVIPIKPRSLNLIGRRRPRRPGLRPPQSFDTAPTLPPSHQLAPATRAPGFLPPPAPPASYKHPPNVLHHGAYLESHALGPTTRKASSCNNSN